MDRGVVGGDLCGVPRPVRHRPRSLVVDESAGATIVDHRCFAHIPDILDSLDSRNVADLLDSGDDDVGYVS